MRLPAVLHTRLSGHPICVTGMGRCGTSLTTALIGLLGVDLGPADQMLPAAEHDNARGYWEQQQLYELNEAILATFGGTWGSPPVLPAGWERSPELDTVRIRARESLEDLFGAREGRWGWKDPRASVTLPFWRDLVGEMDYVLCVRNPADVAASLAKRDSEDLDFEASVALWLRYMRAALENTRGSRRLILRYEDYFTDTKRQLRRLAEFAGVGKTRLDEEILARMEHFIEPGLWHNRDQGDGIDRVGQVSPEASELYAQLFRSQSNGRLGAIRAQANPLVART